MLPEVLELGAHDEACFPAGVEEGWVRPGRVDFEFWQGGGAGEDLFEGAAVFGHFEVDDPAGRRGEVPDDEADLWW